MSKKESYGELCDFQDAFLNFAFWFVVLTIIGAFIAARWFNVCKKCFLLLENQNYFSKLKETLPD